MTAHRLGTAVRAACAACAVIAGCGDNLPPDDPPFTATSGARLALQKYRFDDGTELAVASELYDTELHVRCRPEAWRDGATRCAPTADDAVYSDAGCTALVGLARTITAPTHFLVRDVEPAGRLVARVLRAGAPAAPIAQYWEIAGGACVGPTPVAPGPASFFAVGDELDPGDLVAFHDRELGDGRLGLELRETDDGARVLAGLRDRALGAACAPARQADGSVACEPSAVPAASWFVDAACREPALAVAAGDPPAIVRLDLPSGCASYHRLGRELSPPAYRRDGDACTAVDTPAGGRLFALGEPIELLALARTQEIVAGHRLQRVVLDPGGLRFFDDRLFDPAIGADCRARTVRNAIRCLPVSAVAAAPLFADGCVAPVAAAAVPISCEPPGFATSNRPFQIREIGAQYAGPAFRIDPAGVCQPYAGAPGSELRALGPALDLAGFLGAIYYGER